MLIVEVRTRPHGGRGAVDVGGVKCKFCSTATILASFPLPPPPQYALPPSRLLEEIRPWNSNPGAREAAPYILLIILQICSDPALPTWRRPHLVEKDAPSFKKRRVKRRSKKDASSVACSLDMHPKARHPKTRGGAPPPSALFDEGVMLSPPEQSPARPSQRVPSQPSPSLDGEYDLASNGELFRGPLPGDEGYQGAAANLTFPNPNTAADSSVPGIATLADESLADESLADELDTDYSFSDYTDRRMEYFMYDDYEPQEQVGGGWRAGLRLKITPSPNAERVGLGAQKRRQESYRQAQAAVNEAEANEGPASPAPAKRVVPPIPAKRRMQPKAAAPSTAAAPSAARLPPKVPLSDGAAAPTAAALLPRPGPLPAAPAPNPFQSGPTPIPQRGAGTSRRQARSETPVLRQHTVVPTSLSGPSPGRASSLQPPPTRTAMPAQDYVPIPPEKFRGSLPEFLTQGSFASEAVPPPPPHWPASRLRTPLSL
ncbi:hypothetical protein B0H11DRAFT_1908819 [Mycena galericulata]|nr:hypothetical protein B0H11DRAFT_1908819 [Mycena galericulata]